ncbi:MAG TPA: hypothetical protein VNS63_08075, partial [Blastocatellia bacterium]|nr:hypothetical protein [Blastocatellia bacterium]
APQAASNNKPVTGSGTEGQLTKWTGSNSLGDSVVTENNSGNIGVGTTTPGSKLTVAGTIETEGVKFSDGTLQTTAAVSGLSAVTHDSTLSGSGTQMSPLGIASPLVVRDLDNPALQPFVATLLSVNPNTSFFTVPSGKRLVIEYVSGQGTLPTGDKLLFVRLQINTGGSTVFHRFLPVLTGTEGNVDVFLVSQQTRLYAEPGSSVILSGPPANTIFSVTVSGYLVDIP